MKTIHSTWRRCRRQSQKKSGIPIRDITDKEKVKEDLETYATDMLYNVSGYRLRSLTNPYVARWDMMMIGLKVVEQYAGIPMLSDVCYRFAPSKHVDSQFFFA